MTHMTVFFYPSNTKTVFRFRVDNHPRFFGCWQKKPWQEMPQTQLQNYQAVDYHYTLPEKRVWFSYPPKKWLAHSPEKTTQNSDKIVPLQECCEPASPSGLECFDALFTREPFEKMIFDTWCHGNWLTGCPGKKEQGFSNSTMPF